jgi:hypothetical protein
MWIGAVLLSLVVIPYGSWIVFDLAKELLRSGHNTSGFVMSSLFIVSTALMYWCDATLVMEAVSVRQWRWMRGSLDWVAWFGAITLSAFCIWVDGIRWNAPQLNISRAASEASRDSILLLGVNALILLFDVGLIIHAIRTRRTHSPAR